MRRLSIFSVLRWAAGLDCVSRVGTATLKAIGELVDAATGASHPRYPITIERIARAAKYSASHTFVALRELVRHGFVIREPSPRLRNARGEWWQAPSRYRLVLPDECWTLVQKASATVAAREPLRAPVVAVAPPVVMSRQEQPSDAWTNGLTVRGTCPTADAADVAPRRPAETSRPRNTTDGIEVDRIAARMLGEACTLAADCPEERRFLAVVGLHELQRQARVLVDHALSIGLTTKRILACVREWTARALCNVEQRVESGQHAINILRRFFSARIAWLDAEEKLY
jgi:hypothetical protein